MRKMTGDKEYSSIGRERELVGVDVGRRAACPQRGKAQQRLRRWRSPERQKRSRAAHGQENQKAQQKREKVVLSCQTAV